MNQTIYQLKVTLRNSQPRIWRRFQVSGDANLHRLHSILQVVMGWTNSHLYRFEIGDIEYSDPNLIDDDLDELDFDNSRKTRLNKVLPLEKSSFLYIYDFGDGWEHDVLIEKIFPPEPGLSYPNCLAGERACPPEDCGGIWGYADLLKVIRNSKHKEYESMMEWLGGSFDPEKFDINEINKSLTRFQSKNKQKQSVTQPATLSLNKSRTKGQLVTGTTKNNIVKYEENLPVATICYYGPDDKIATKVAVGIITSIEKEPDELKRWWGKDIAHDLRIQEEIAAFIKEHNVKKVVVTDGIIGCPHEEGFDYPIGEDCPFCPFWRGKQ